MKYSGFLISCSAVLGLAVLAGCAENPPATPAVASATSWIKAPPVLAVGTPFMLDFEKMSAKLTPQQEDVLTGLLPRLKESKTIIVRGFCNKRDIGNAKDAALARAINVEKFLVKQGVPDQKITLRYNTEDAAHGVELEISQ